MADPYFSVIIPTYNRADRIGSTITTVLSQEFKDFELLIVDDGSTDNTEATVRSYADSRIRYFQKSNEERAAARNTGVRASLGKYVTFLDSDDKMYPQHLSRVREKLEYLNEPAVYHQSYEIVDESGRLLSREMRRRQRINDLLFTKGNVMSCIGVFLLRDVAISNPFNEDRLLSGVEDWELWIRLAAQYPIHHGEDVTAALVQHAGRSVQTIHRDKLKTRIERLLTVVRGNTNVMEKFSSLMPQLTAVGYSYISLHLSESGGNRSEAIGYLFRTATSSLPTLFQRRTLAILRNVLLIG